MAILNRGFGNRYYGFSGNRRFGLLGLLLPLAWINRHRIRSFLQTRFPERFGRLNESDNATSAISDRDIDRAA